MSQFPEEKVQGKVLEIRCEDDDRPNFSGDWMMVKVPVPKREYSMSAIIRLWLIKILEIFDPVFPVPQRGAVRLSLQSFPLELERYCNAQN